MKLEVAKLERVILRKLDQLKAESDRGYVHVLKLWLALDRSIKIKDPDEAYRRYYAALELLVKEGFVRQRPGSDPLSAGEVKLTAEGIKELDRINRGFLRRFFDSFGTDIKSEFIRLLFLIILLIIAFLLGLFKREEFREVLDLIFE